jgi:hypothetical protein
MAGPTGDVMATVGRTGVGEGRAGSGDADAPSFGSGGAGVRGASEIEAASAREAPQNRQNCECGSEPPRHRGQRRSIGSLAVGMPRSTTRPGAMGDAASLEGPSSAGGRMVCGGSEGESTTRPPPARAVRGLAASSAADAALLGCARRVPHVTQKRRLRGFRLPHRRQGAESGAEIVAFGSASPLRSPAAAKFIGGAGGR